ncbi:MAG: hypothetical protein PHI18_08035 [bacterium]|nr:hypothetical protein [bacterium]
MKIPLRILLRLTLGFSLALLAGCGGRRHDSPLLARAGERELRQSDMEAAVGLPLDSLSESEQTRWVLGWVERALVEQEAVRAGLDKRPDLRAKVQALQADVYHAQLLSELPGDVPSDSAIAVYYEAHREEFLRSVDAYLIELYWSEDRATMATFQRAIQRGDTGLLAEGRVSSEGRWLTERGELDPLLELELSELAPGTMTTIRPYDDGFRSTRMIESFPAGTVLDLSAVRDEIEERLILEQSRARQDSLDSWLRRRYPVTIHLPEAAH